MGITDLPVMKVVQDIPQSTNTPQKEMDQRSKREGAEVPTASPTTSSTTEESPTLKHGRWSPEEKLLFLHGLKLFGRGRWKKIRTFLPFR